MEIILEPIDTLKGTIDYICDELSKLTQMEKDEEKKINLSLDLNNPEYIMVTKETENVFLCAWYRKSGRNSFYCKAQDPKMHLDVREMVMIMSDLYLKEAFEDKCYKAYQLRWMLEHGYSLDDLYKVMLKYEKEMFDPDDFRASDGSMAYEMEFDESDLERSAMQARDIFLFEQGFGSAIVFAGKNEFLNEEYRKADYMDELLSMMPDSEKLKADYKKYCS